QFNHVEHSIAAGKRQVFGFDLTLGIDRHAHDAEEALGRGEARLSKIGLARKHRAGKLAPVRQALVDFETDHRGGAHLDRRYADFAVTLGEMPVSGREQPALDEYRQEELSASGQLLHIEIAAV